MLPAWNKQDPFFYITTFNNFHEIDILELWPKPNENLWVPSPKF